MLLMERRTIRSRIRSDIDCASVHRSFDRRSALVTARSTKPAKRALKTKTAGTKSARPKNGAAKKAAKRVANKPDPVESLRVGEAAQVLQVLSRRHPELRSEIDEISLAMLAAVDTEKLGAALGDRLCSLDFLDAIDPDPRSGRYVAEWDLAQHTLDTLMKPYVSDLQRLIELGLKEAAQSTCLGIIIGLYQARDIHAGDSLLAHAPDFCENEAHYVAGRLAKQSGRLHRSRWQLPENARSLIPDWPELFPRGVRRKR